MFPLVPLMVNTPLLALANEVLLALLLIVEVPLSISRLPWLLISIFAVSAVILNDPPEAMVSDPGPSKVMVPVGSIVGPPAAIVTAVAIFTVWVPWRSIVPPPVRFEFVPMVVVVELRYSVLPEATSMLPALVSNVVALIVAVVSISIIPSLMMLALIVQVPPPLPVWVVLIVPVSVLVSVPLLTVSV